jgi:hypothetical protein
MILSILLLFAALSNDDYSARFHELAQHERRHMTLSAVPNAAHVLTAYHP